MDHQGPRRRGTSPKFGPTHRLNRAGCHLPTPGAQRGSATVCLGSPFRSSKVLPSGEVEVASPLSPPAVLALASVKQNLCSNCHKSEFRIWGDHFHAQPLSSSPKIPSSFCCSAGKGPQPPTSRLPQNPCSGVSGRLQAGKGKTAPNSITPPFQPPNPTSGRCFA